VNKVPNNKIKKNIVPVKQHHEEKYIKTYNPTKSKAGKIILILIVAGMFLGMLVAAVFGMIQVLNS
jgi:hypothetical protein